MSTNIPPLVSSSPPPLCETDEEEEDDDHEFGIFTAAEDLGYNGCISFQVNDSKISVPSSDAATHLSSQQNKEHDCTSQDSTTDSGLCPDSEEMSPTPHSDDERTEVVKMCTSERLGNSLVNDEKTHDCLSTTVIKDCVATRHKNWSNLNVESVHLTNGQNEVLNSDNCDDFGGFESCSYNNQLEHSKNGISESQIKCNGSEPNLFSIDSSEEKSSKIVLSEEVQEENTGKTSYQVNEDNNVLDLILDPVNLNGSDDIKEISNEPFQSVFASDLDNFGDFQFQVEEVDGKTHLETPVQVILKDNKVCELEQVNKLEDEQINSLQGFSETTSVHNMKSVDNDDDSFDDYQFQLEKPTSDSHLNNLAQEDQSGQVSNLALESSGRVEERHLDIEEIEDEFDDFQFESQVVQSEVNLNTRPVESTIVKEESEDFGEFSDFADFSSSDFKQNEDVEGSEDLSAGTSCLPLINEQWNQKTESYQFSKLESWSELFPAEENKVESPESISLSIEESTTWKKLFPIEASPALSYQWNNSCANKKLLSSLNIDSRNILFMPWCNMSVPRFAANLGFGPLEPVRASEPIQPINNSSVFVSTSEETVPDAHFDWVSSGLTNPLDCSSTICLCTVLCFIRCLVMVVVGQAETLLCCTLTSSLHLTASQVPPPSHLQYLTNP